MELLTKKLDHMINYGNFDLHFWRVFTILKLKSDCDWKTLIHSLPQIWFYFVIFNTFGLIKVFLFFSINIKIQISGVPNLAWGMPKLQIVCSQSFNFFPHIVWKISFFPWFHYNHDIFVTWIATNMNFSSKEAETLTKQWCKFQFFSFSSLWEIAIFNHFRHFM